MRSDLFSPENLESTSSDRFGLQNPQLLRVALDGDLVARQGAMVAYQGDVEFEYQGAGGVGRFLKKALTGEGFPTMRVRGRGDVFFARGARRVFLMHLEGDALSVNGDNVLAFDSALSWDISRIQGAGVAAGGLFNMRFEGSGTVALTSHGQPVVLQTDAPTFVDAQSAIAWSAGLTTSVKSSFKVGALVGRGSGELAQLAFAGSGFVVVQPSEGLEVPPHSHGSSGGGGLGNLFE